MTTIWIDPDELNTTSALMVNLAKQIADLAMGLAQVGGPPPENIAAELVQAQKNLATIAEVYVLSADVLAQVAAEITGDQSLASAFDSAVGPLVASSVATGSAAIAEAGSQPDVVTIGGGTSPLLAGLVQGSDTSEVTIGGGVSPALQGLTQEPAASDVTVGGGGVSPALAGLVHEPAADEVTIAGTPTPAFGNLADPAASGAAASVNPQANAFGISIQEQTGTAGQGDIDVYEQPAGIGVGVGGDGGFNYTDNFGNTNATDAIAGTDPDTGLPVLST
jgi:hypothetical protein